jgi:hypothetical protein
MSDCSFKFLPESPSSQSPLLTASITSPNFDSDDLENQSVINDKDNLLNSSKTRKQKSKVEKWYSFCNKLIPFGFNISNLKIIFKRLKISLNNKLLSLLLTLLIMLIISLIIPLRYIFQNPNIYENINENGIENPNRNYSYIVEDESNDSYNSQIAKLLNSSLNHLNGSSDSLNTYNESSNSNSEIYQSLNHSSNHLNESYNYQNEINPLFEEMKLYFSTRYWTYLEHNKSIDFSDSHLAKLLTLSLHHLHEAPPYKKHKDFRLTPALYLNYILNRLNENNNTLSADLKLPFSWSDWIDFGKRLYPSKDYFLKSNNNPIFSCEQFAGEIGFSSATDLKQNGKGTCINLNEAEVDQLENFYYPHFKIIGPFKSKKMNLDARIVYGASYVYHESPPPKRLVFVDGSKQTNLIIPISNSEPIKNSVLYEITNFDIDEEVGEKENIHKKVEKLLPINELMKLVLEDQFNIYSNDKVIVDFARFSGNRLTDEGDDNIHIKLDRSDFQNPNTLNDIRDSLFEIDMDNSLDSNLYSNIINEYERHPDGNYPKYFYEADTRDSKDEGAHHDWRFYNDKKLSNEYKKLSASHRIMKAWLRFTNNENIVSWPNYGTLLGYSFNKYTLPWDNDHDVQVSTSAMWKLAKYYNQSLIIDCTSKDPFSSGYGQYYLDVSSCFFNRSNPNHNNAIDARFIDIQTGMYIDITLLSITKDKELLLNGHFEHFFGRAKAQFYRFAKQYPNVKQFIRQDELIMCKNNHVFSLAELTDFDRDLFEGEYVYIPRSYVKMLDRIFPQRKRNWNFGGYTWRSEIGLWIKDKRCELGKFDRYGVSCLQNEFNQLLIHFMKGLDTDIKTISTIDSPNEHIPNLVFPDWESVILFDKNEEN